MNKCYLDLRLEGSSWFFNFSNLDFVVMCLGIFVIWKWEDFDYMEWF